MIPTALPSGGSVFPVSNPLTRSPYESEDAMENYNEVVAEENDNYTNFKSVIRDAMAQQVELFNREAEFNSAEAAKNRDWQQYMSSSAYRRAVEDLQAAGLNKWLALNGGSLGAASTPSGSSASASTGSSQYGNIVKAFLTFLASLTTSSMKSIASLIPF